MAVIKTTVDTESV